MWGKYVIYEKQIKSLSMTYIRKRHYLFLYTEEAQDLVLAFTEANADYTAEQCQYISPEDGNSWIKTLPKYGWDKYTIQEVNERMVWRKAGEWIGSKMTTSLDEPVLGGILVYTVNVHSIDGSKIIMEEAKTLLGWRKMCRIITI